MLTKKHLMDLEGLVILSAIAKHGGKRKASDAIGTSVDTINKYIENLEANVGYTLLMSNGRGSCLTERAKHLVANIDSIEKVFNQMYSQKKDDVNGEVRISMPLSISNYIEPFCIGQFFDKYPDIKLHSISSLDMPAFSSLDVDIGLSFNPPESADWVIMYAKKIELGYFSAPQYLAAHGYPVDYEDMIENHRLVYKPGMQNYFKSWKDILKRAKHICYESNSTFALMEVLKNGIGIGILPMRYKDRGMVCLDNIKCENDLTIYIIARTSSKDTPRVRAVIDFYRELLDGPQN